MKSSPLLAIFLAIACLNAAHAQDEGTPACGVLLCMSGHNSAAPHECKPFVDAYFDIKVYHHGTFKTKFDPARTAAKRYETILGQCGEARQIDRDRVHVKFGHLEYNPFIFN